jgi:hypothetical protein
MLCVPTTLHWQFPDAVGACLDRLEHARPAPCRPTPETDSTTRPRRDGLGWAASDVPLQHESESESYAKHRQRLTPHASQATRRLFLSDSVPVGTRLCSTRHPFGNGWAQPCFSRFNAGYGLFLYGHVTSLHSTPPARSFGHCELLHCEPQFERGRIDTSTATPSIFSSYPRGSRS